MEFSFECGCGEEVSGFTRGHSPRFDTRISCSECETVYAMSLTTIEQQFELDDDS